MPWARIALLPTTLSVAWLAQRTQSTWPPLVVHGAGNALFTGLVVIAAVARPRVEGAWRRAAVGWWAMTDSNRRPTACKAAALPLS